MVLPGTATEITPPYAHCSVAPCTSAGAPPISVLGALGVHGATGTGTHGMGVNVPSAAAVAAATCGFASDWHMPNGMMFTIGAISVMFATGRPSTVALGRTTIIVDGIIPNVQVSVAPATTGLGMPYSFDPLTDLVNGSPVVVTKHRTSRSLPCCQLRADGSRYVIHSPESG